GVRAYATPDIENRDAIDRAAAELVRSPVLEVLELVTDFQQANVVGPVGDDSWRPANVWSPQREGRRDARLTQQRSPRETTRMLRRHRRGLDRSHHRGRPRRFG